MIKQSRHHLASTCQKPDNIKFNDKPSNQHKSNNHNKSDNPLNHYKSYHHVPYLTDLTDNTIHNNHLSKCVKSSSFQNPAAIHNLSTHKTSTHHPQHPQNTLNKPAKNVQKNTTQSINHATASSKNIMVAPYHPFMVYLENYPTLSAQTYYLLNWDASLCIHINKFSNHHQIAAFFKVISRLGDGWFWGAMLAVAAGLQCYHLYKQGYELMQLSFAQMLALWLPLITTLMVSVLGIGIYKLLKLKTLRPRPYQVHQVIIMGERPLDVFSFPSGHTLQAVLITSVLGVYFPVLLWVMLPFTVLVALSRMVLGLHYPTDVVMGALLGMALAKLAPTVDSTLQQFVMPLT